MRIDTLLARAGRKHESRRAVNPSIQRASTILFDSIAEFEGAQQTRRERGQLYYGTYGTETTMALESALAELEGGYGATAFSSGIAAIVATLQAFVGSGEHVLLPDSVYGPVRLACDGVLRDHGIETTYYDPLLGSALEAQIRPNTRLIYLESPGSLTFEVQDVPAIVAVARKHRIPTAIDNTWATPYYFNALARGVDVSIHAATKYIGGHSDVILGVAIANEEGYAKLRRSATLLGYSASPDDCWLVLRGLRTLGARLRVHGRSALTIATYLAANPRIDQVLYPALPGAPGHDLWRRDFSGATGLFSFTFERSVSEAAAIAMIERLRLFAIGASWGGYESLALLIRPKSVRSLRTWEETGPMVRLQIGLEDPEDLIADLEQALSAV